MKKKVRLLGINIAVLLSVYAVTAYAGHGIREQKESGENMTIPEIQYPAADGNQGYYKTRPELSIFHRQADAVTKYEFLSADFTKKTGSLELMEGQTEESVYLSEYFREGENILRVWMETKPPKPGEDTSEEENTGDNKQEGNSTEDNDSREEGMENNGVEDVGMEENGSEGNGTEGSDTESDGTEDNGSESDGTEDNSSESDGTEDNSSESDGTEGSDTESDGTEDNGSESDGTEDEGIESDGAEDNGFESNGTENNGSESDGMEDHESEGSGTGSGESDENGAGGDDAEHHEPGDLDTEEDGSGDMGPEEQDTPWNTTGEHVRNTEEEDQEIKEEPPSEEDIEPGEPEIVFEKELRFRLDTKKPGKVRFSYDKAVRDGSILTNEPVKLTLKSEDGGSGMEAVYYKTGDGTTGVLPGDGGIITLTSGFQGTVEAYAADKAGNQSEPAVSETILCEDTPPEIRIEAEGGIDSWHVEPVKIDVEVSDDSLSSGLKNLKCYVGGELTVNKEYDFNAGPDTVEAGFTVDVPSESGKGIPVSVESQDWAGNYETQSSLVYIDNTAPDIQSEGLHDQMITGEPVKGKMIIREENDLAFAKMEVRKITSDKKKELLEEKKTEPNPFSGSQEIQWDVALEKDGTYEIFLTAKDRAGHELSRSSQVIIDQTNPVIRYVDQMQGVFVPYFQWNYGKEEVVQDESDYSYDIFLDGAFYSTGKKVSKEGVKMLQVRAVDAAGNESTAEAVFQIDHTPPSIRVYEVEDGGSYQDSASVSISVDGKGEYLKEISINSEKMKLEADCQIFSQSFWEPGDYQIRVLAEDLAGNQEREQITFRIEEQKQLAGGGWKPVTRIFRNVKETPGQSVKQKVEKQEKSPAARWLLLCFVLVVSAGVLKAAIGFGKSRKR